MAVEVLEPYKFHPLQNTWYDAKNHNRSIHATKYIYIYIFSFKRSPMGLHFTLGTEHASR